MSVVITGASSGIGLCAALAFARRGANLVLVARDAGQLASAAHRCRTAGAHVLAVAGDVTDAERMRQVVQAAVAAFGRVDVWVNNAGTSLWGPFEQIPADVHRRLIDVDLTGAVNGAHAVVPQFLAQGGSGVIINVVSIGGRVPSAWAASYSAAKFGLAGFTEALRAELGARIKIAVCGVYPAFVDTPTAARSGNYTGRTLRPVPPVVSPERVAAAIVSLAEHPRRSRRVGALHARSAAYALAPDLAGRFAAKLGGHHFLRSGAPAEPTEGALFDTRRSSVTARGGWGSHERTMARAMTVGVAAALLATGAVTRIRRR